LCPFHCSFQEIREYYEENATIMVNTQITTTWTVKLMIHASTYNIRIIWMQTFQLKNNLCSGCHDFISSNRLDKLQGRQTFKNNHSEDIAVQPRPMNAKKVDFLLVMPLN
jgi:hypothetical protein